MKRQAVNPFLPSWEYIPDGELRRFGDRVYLYGSHDRFGGREFYMNDYVCWSAPVDDLSDWRHEGGIWRCTDDPGNREGKMFLYAPDCVQGPDGSYYLYYFLGKQFLIGVAVCDEPAGKFEFHGYVHYADGSRLGDKEGDAFHEVEKSVGEAEDPIRSETAVSYLYRKRKTGFPVFYNRIEHSG